MEFLFCAIATDCEANIENEQKKNSQLKSIMTINQHAKWERERYCALTSNHFVSVWYLGMYVLSVCKTKFKLQLWCTLDFRLLQLRYDGRDILLLYKIVLWIFRFSLASPWHLLHKFIYSSLKQLLFSSFFYSTTKIRSDSVPFAHFFYVFFFFCFSHCMSNNKMENISYFFGCMKSMIVFVKSLQNKTESEMSIERINMKKKTEWHNLSDGAPTQAMQIYASIHLHWWFGCDCLFN